MTANGYFNGATRAFFCYFNLYNPSKDIFISTEILIEFGNTGLVSPTHVHSRAYKAYVFETSEEKGVRAAEFFRFFCIFYISYFLIFLKHYKMKNWRKIIQYKYLEKLVVDILIVCFVFINFILIHVASDKTTDEILNSSEYIDLVHKGVLYDNIFILESILLFLLVLKILNVLTIIKSVRIIVKSISFAFKQVMTYMLIIMPLFIAFTIIGMGIYGAAIDEYSTFTKSFVSVLFFTVGQTDTIELFKFNVMWTVIYVVIVTLVIIYLLISSFIAVYTDAYIRTIMVEGYPEEEDYRRLNKTGDASFRSSKWTVRDAIKWMLDLVPNKWLYKIGILTQNDMEKLQEEKSKRLKSDENEEFSKLDAPKDEDKSNNNE